jgi:hypothetical protein
MYQIGTLPSGNEEIRLGAGLSKEEAAALPTPELLDVLIFWYEANEIRIRAENYLLGVAALQEFLVSAVPAEKMPADIKPLVVISMDNIKALKDQRDKLSAMLDGAEMQALLSVVMDEFARRGESVVVTRHVKGTDLPAALRIGSPTPVATMAFDVASKSLESLWSDLEERNKEAKAGLQGFSLGGLPAIVYAILAAAAYLYFLVTKESNLLDKIITIRAALPQDIADKIMSDYRGIKENTNLFDALSNVAWIIVGAAAVIGLTMAGTAIVPGLLSGLGNWIGGKIGAPVIVAAPLPGMQSGASGPAAAIARGPLPPPRYLPTT